MKASRWNYFIVVFVLVSASFTFFGFNSDYDSLHKRIFNTSLSETKNGIVAKKVITDRLYFKNGKLFSDFLYRKFNFKWIRYRINKDSVYTDSTNTLVRLLLVEASATDENNQSVFIDLATLEWDLDGTIKITKNDKLKRYYDMAGREKGGKPKKVKRSKKRIIEFKENSNPDNLETQGTNL